MVVKLGSPGKRGFGKDQVRIVKKQKRGRQTKAKKKRKWPD